jgi:hypothetical protein
MTPGEKRIFERTHKPLNEKSTNYDLSPKTLALEMSNKYTMREKQHFRK